MFGDHQGDCPPHGMWPQCSVCSCFADPTGIPDWEAESQLALRENQGQPGRPDLPHQLQRLTLLLRSRTSPYIARGSPYLSERSVSRGSEYQPEPAPAPAPLAIGETNSMVHAVDLAHQKAQTTPQLSFGQDGVTVQQPVVSLEGFQRKHECSRTRRSGRWDLWGIGGPTAPACAACAPAATLRGMVLRHRRLDLIQI